MVELWTFGVVSGLGVAWYFVWLHMVDRHHSVIAAEAAYAEKVASLEAAGEPLPFDPSWGYHGNKSGVNSERSGEFAAQSRDRNPVSGRLVGGLS